MKCRVLQVLLTISLILTLVITDFLILGYNISIAVSDIGELRESATNVKNVEFDAYFEDSNGNKDTNFNKFIDEKETFLHLKIEVKKEGYFNGTISVKNNNFILKESNSKYVKNIENNNIQLNQINAVTEVEIQIKIEPIRDEIFNKDLLQSECIIELEGIYRDSTQKDIKVNAERKIQFNIVQDNNAQNIINNANIITNKIVKIDGQERRMLQISYDLGLKENNYPIKQIDFEMEFKDVKQEIQDEGEHDEKENIDNKEINKKDNVENTKPQNDVQEQEKNLEENSENEKFEPIEVEKLINLNNMKSCKYKYENSKHILKLENKEDEKNEINWKQKGNENIILTFIFDKDISLKDKQVNIQEKLTLYDLAEITSNNVLILNDDEKDEIINVTSKNKEETIYKGKLNSVIDRQYISVTTIKVNEKRVPQYLWIKENEAKFILNEEDKTKEIDANVLYSKTMIKKEQFDSIFGEDGIIKIYNEKGEEIGNINSSSKPNDKGYITIDYGENSCKELTIKTTKPILESEISFMHIKTIKPFSNSEEKNVNKLVEKVEAGYVTEDNKIVKNGLIEKQTILENSQTEAQFEINKESLSTVNTNNVEIKVILNSNSEKYDLFKNPQIAIKFPSQVESIQINSIDLIYENELKIKDYKTENGIIRLNLEGEQTEYKNSAIEGATIVINADVTLNKSEISKDEEIKMAYTNEKESVKNEDIGYKIITKSIKIIAPKEEVINKEEINKNVITEEENNQKNGNTNSETQLTRKVVSNLASSANSKLKNATTKITATVCDEEIDGKVKNGEVIKYKIEVSNIGTQDINNLQVTGIVPNGTTLVVPEQNYEYAGPVYYKELEERTYSDVIDNLKAGEKIYKEYEVRVNNDTPENTNLSCYSQINYDEIQKQSEQIQIETEKGNLRVTQKRITDRRTELCEGQTVMYSTIIENISDTKQENIKVDLMCSENIEVYSIVLIDYQNSTSPINGNSINNIEIGDLEPGQIKILSFYTTLRNFEQGQETIQLFSIAKQGEVQYKSNKWIDTLANYNVTISMTSDTETQYVKSQDTIRYIITIKNEGNSPTMGLYIEDKIPKQLTVRGITVDGESIELLGGNDLYIPCRVETNSQSTVIIEATVDPSPVRDKAEAITNVAHAIVYGEEKSTSSAVNHIIEANEDNTNIQINPPINNPENQEEPNNNQSGEQQNNENGVNNSNGQENINEDEDQGGKTTTPESAGKVQTKKIVGIAWQDENADGKKDNNEKLISNIKVRLLDTETNNYVKDETGNILEAETNENGIYILEKIQKGKYIVIFDYNTSKYGLTKYKKDGVTEAENSNVMINELVIDGEKKQVASTDIIEIKDENISDINIGLIELKNFDLKLDKYVSKISIQDSKGTTIHEFDNSNLAKVELDYKTIEGTTVLIEYNIIVTNNGELEGYAKKIIDYMPNNLKFSSEINKDWYQSGEYLYSTSLENNKIAPGESKILKLVLTKTMSEENTGLINNRAEIVETYNELGIADTNSIPGNNQKGENDMGEADVILSIKTGKIINFSMTVGVIISLGCMAIIFVRKRFEKVTVQS